MPAGTGIDTAGDGIGTPPVNVFLVRSPYFGPATAGVSVAVSFGSSPKP